MRRIALVFLLAGFCFALLAVGVASAQSTPTKTPILSPTQTPTTGSVISDTAQSATVLNDANLRSGPGTTFAVSGSAKAGDKVAVVGASPAGDWYQLDNGKWIAAFLVELSGASAPSPVTTATPTRAVVPIPTATPQVLGSLPYTFTGSGDSIVDVSAYSDQLILALILGNFSSGYFAVQSYDILGDQIDLLVNTTEVYAGARPINLTGEPADFLEIKATGKWQIVFFPLAAASRITKGTTFSGEGDSALIVDGESGRTAQITGNGESGFFAIVGYSADGRRQLIVNTTDPYDGTVRLQNKTLLLVIQAVGDWSILMK